MGGPVKPPSLARCDQELPGTFRGRLEQGWRLDFSEILTVKKISNSLGDLGAQANVALEVGLAQVEVAILH